MKSYFSAAVILLAILTATTLFAQPPYDTGWFQTPVAREMFDEEGFLELHGGQATPITHHRGISQVLNSRETHSEYHGTTFGDTKNLGPRHLIIPLKASVPVGSLFVCGVGTPYVLKAEVADPRTADPSDDSLWIPGRRILSGELTESEQGLTEDAYYFWIFPSGTQTAAIRFTHIPQAMDKSYAGWLGGLYVLPHRVMNVAPYAVPFAASENHHAAKLNDQIDNNKWSAWDNGRDGREVPVSRENPEFVSLVWNEPVTLTGLCTVWSGFWDADVETYVGPADRHPNESADPADWKKIVSRTGIRAGYTQAMYPIWYDFGQTLTTRAVRLRMNETAHEDHDHLRDNMKNGHRVWLGEILAIHAIPDRADDAAILASIPKRAEEAHPPIPIRFTLDDDALVTLVIEKDGVRVRNLIAETPFPKGENTVYWDGSDDLLRDTEAAHHGLYRIPTQLVAPGAYTVRGLTRKPLSLRYEFSVYNEGNPPWPTADNTGGWLTNHTAASCALWVPAEQSPTGAPLVYLGSYVSEGGHGLAWFEVDADKKEFSITKRGGVGWVGGAWTGAQYLARDYGKDRNTDHNLYVASVWHAGDKGDPQAEIRLTGLKSDGGSDVKKYTFDLQAGTHDDHDMGAQLGGVAIYNGVAVFSLTKANKIVTFDHPSGELRQTIPWDAPGGLAYNAAGELFLLSGGKLYRCPKGTLPTPGARPLISQLDDPKQMTFDAAGNIYISENGKSHCVRVFDKTGKPLRVIGKTGVPKAGPYDPLQMQHPNGMTIDDAGRLWVTETDYQPKRVSVWTPEGRLIRAFYGPAAYGGGGKLDPYDPTKFFYQGMEFKLEWKVGTFQPTRVYFRQDADPLGIPDGWPSSGLPETPIYPNPAGPRYFTNAFNSCPVGGAPLAVLWYDDPKTGVARPVAAYGRINEWSILKGDAFKSRLPEGIELNERGDWNGNARFLWLDANRDGLMQPEEVQCELGDNGGVIFTVVDGGLAILATRVTDTKQRHDDTPSETIIYMGDITAASPVPRFRFSERKTLATDVENPRSSGGDQALYDAKGGRTIATLGIQPFAPESVCGTKDGQPVWSYPNPWPGLHASHESARPTQRGQLIGLTRLLGDFIQTSYPHPVFAINGNQGNIYLMTSDGMFVAELFRDVRLAPLWAMPRAERGMEVGNLTLHDENFWPSITQTADGKVFLVDGAKSALVRIDGLDTLREIKPFALKVTDADVKAAETWLVDAERRRQQTAGQPTLRVPVKAGVTVDGKLDDWAGADWAVIDRSGTAAYFDSNSRPYDITAAVRISGDKLAVAFRTNMKDLLRNSGELPQALFKNGGCLDVMLGTNPAADPDRRDAVTGDVRLLITQVDGKPRAVLYRAVVPGTKTPVPFSSPSRTITLDEVADVSDQLEFAAGDDGVFEIAIPLSVLHLSPQPGMKIKADLGVLRGDGVSTLARVYWSNKATAIVSDVPSEAQLTPALWGNWIFE